MWFYVVPGLVFLALTSLMLAVLTWTEPDPTRLRDLTGERAPMLQAESLVPNEPLPSPAVLASTAGKPVLVNFFASWCGPCEAEMPYLRQMAEQYDVIMIGIAWNDTPEKVAAWRKKTNDPFRFTGMDDGATATDYGVRGVPESFLIDRKGRVVRHIEGPITPDIIARELAPFLK